MKCYRCPNQTRDEQTYACDSCIAEYESHHAKTEAKSRTICCPSCDAKIGEPCLTGSGVERGSSHMTREKLAKKVAR
jgi:hypothetical protein